MLWSCGRVLDTELCCPGCSDCHCADPEQGQGCETSLCGLIPLVWWQECTSPHPRDLQWFHWEAKPPEPESGCQDSNNSLVASTKKLKVLQLAGKSPSSLLWSSMALVKWGAWVLDYFSLVFLKLKKNVPSNVFQGENPIERDCTVCLT